MFSKPQGSLQNEESYSYYSFSYGYGYLCRGDTFKLTVTDQYSIVMEYMLLAFVATPKITGMSMLRKME